MRYLSHIFTATNEVIVIFSNGIDGKSYHLVVARHITIKLIAANLAIHRPTYKPCLEIHLTNQHITGNDAYMMLATVINL